jgi:hypothetical protein
MKTSSGEVAASGISRRHLIVPVVFTLLLTGCAAHQGSLPASASDSREEIYVLRSIREQHVSSVEWCSQDRTGFAPLPADAERMFSLWSVQTHPGDGTIVNAKVNRVAEGRTCFGPTADRSVLNFYAEGKIGGTPYVGAGDCRIVAVDSPEKGLVLLRCVLTLRGLPPPYVGGMLTSNTIGSKAALGGETDPPGYTQNSIATIRLWKSR